MAWPSGKVGRDIDDRIVVVVVVAIRDDTSPLGVVMGAQTVHSSIDGAAVANIHGHKH